jgi:hypothetical protein
MNPEAQDLGSSTIAFAMAATITVLFNTALACAKDAYKPLNSLMNEIAWHNWITQGIADVLLFFVLGLLFSRMAWPSRSSANRVISVLVGAVVLAGLGLFAWYAAF